jgi:polygalacturonase
MKSFSLAVICFVLIGSSRGSSASVASFNVRDFGAVGEGTNKDTVAFQKALDACAVSGGGEVLVPAGKYLIGSVQIGNHTILRLAQESVIVGSSDINDYGTWNESFGGTGFIESTAGQAKRDARYYI